jgi:EEF1A lysine methyltransferase 2
VELDNFVNHGDEGEIWFGRGVERKVIDWIAKNINTLSKSSVRILDLGCGNGHFTLKLLENGFTNSFGVDYSPAALQLARNLLAESDILKNVDTSNRFFTTDILDGSSVPDELVKSFDLIVDKGTFDAISLNPEFSGTHKTLTIAHSFKETLRKLFAPASQHKLFIITSCNWTTPELEAIMKPDFLPVAEIEHSKFVFGGISGQDVSSVIFKLNQGNDAIISNIS